MSHIFDSKLTPIVPQFQFFLCKHHIRSVQQPLKHLCDQLLSVPTLPIYPINILPQVVMHARDIIPPNLATDLLLYLQQHSEISLPPQVYL